MHPFWIVSSAVRLAVEEVRDLGSFHADPEFARRPVEHALRFLDRALHERVLARKLDPAQEREELLRGCESGGVGRPGEGLHEMIAKPRRQSVGKRVILGYVDSDRTG